MKKIKNGFTLAEVLISIGLIGVIAAVTLPALSVSIQKRSAITSLKKASTTLNEAIRLMGVDEDADIRNTYCGINYKSSEADVKNKCFENWLKQMSADNSKLFGANCTKSWCKYKVTPQKTSETYNPTSSAMLQTSDGIAYLFINGSGEIAVDTNGIEKGPNEGGKDIFRFYIDYENDRIAPGGSTDDPENSTDDTVHCTNKNYNDNCTAEVLINSEIKYY